VDQPEALAARREPRLEGIHDFRHVEGETRDSDDCGFFGWKHQHRGSNRRAKLIAGVFSAASSSFCLPEQISCAVINP
jgi:hypothetical protein